MILRFVLLYLYIILLFLFSILFFKRCIVVIDYINFEKFLKKIVFKNIFIIKVLFKGIIYLIINYLCLRLVEFLDIFWEKFNNNFLIGVEVDYIFYI